MYHLGAFTAVAGLLESTKESYDPKSKNVAAFNNNVQLALSYFKEAYYPIGRFSKVYTWVERLMTGQSQQVLEARRDVWEANRLLVECNVGYLMLEKLRVLNEFRKCREGARNVVDKLQ
jgi:hypothetical protein